MNETQRQILLQAVTHRQELVTDDALFDALDNVRVALSTWNLQGAIPYAQELREWGLLAEDESASLSVETQPEEAEMQPVAEGAPLLDDNAVQGILTELRRRISASDPGSADHTTLRAIRQAVHRWRETRDGPLPHADELAAWGIWPPTPDAATPDPDDALQPEFDAARALAEKHPYQAIKQLEDLQLRARGNLAAPLATALSQTRVALTRRTEALAIEARRVVAQRPQDLEAQATAWRAVTALNPESYEAQEALSQLELRVQEAIADELDELVRLAQDAANRNHLPDLNACLGRAEGLRQRGERGDLPADLAARAKTVEVTVKDLRQATRDDLGVASTKKVQGDLRGAYHLAREYFEQGIPVVIDTAGILGAAGAEVQVGDFFQLVGADFLAATRQKVDERLAAGRAAKRQSPDQALADLVEAQGWLTDEVWTIDHKQSLRSQLEEVEREIEAVKRLQTAFNQARKKVTAARQPGVPAQEQVRLLIEAQQLYPDYPSIAEYIEEARDNLAGQLVGDVETAIAEAHRQTGLEQFDAARSTLQQARDAALLQIPQPKADSLLAQALAHVAQEEQTINQAEQALARLLDLLKQVDAKLSDYDADKALLTLNEARALLEQVPEAQRDQTRVKDARGRVAARQGDAENYDAGRRAYEKRDWAAAYDYFDKITSAFGQKAEADQLRRRAQAVVDIEAARQAETAKKWGDALKSYRAAAYLLTETGEDGLTGGLLQEAQEALARLSPIEQNDREITQALTTAREQLEQARARVASREKQTLRDRLSPLPELAAIVATLEAKAQTLSTLGAELDDVLSQARAVWRAALFPALREVVKNPHTEEVLLEAAHQRARELKAAGLLYADKTGDNVEVLYYELEAQHLDKTYERLKTLPLTRWIAEEEARRRQNNPQDTSTPTQLEWLLAIEDNRQARWSLPLMTKSDALHEQLLQARQARMTLELRQEEEKSVAAAQCFLAENIRTGRWPTEPQWLHVWIDLCWRADNWESADVAARRFSDTSLEDRETHVKIWLELNRVARAFAGGDAKTALTQLDALRDMYSAEDLFDAIEEKLKRSALTTLLDNAAAERRELESMIARARAERRELETVAESVRAERCFAMAQKYTQVLLLDENNREAQEGLRWTGEYIEPLIAQRCKDAAALKVSRGDIKTARDTAARLLIELQAIEDVAPYLTLSDEIKAELPAALEQIQAKKQWWDTVISQRAEFERELGDALSLPTSLDEEDPERGGWDFAEARRLLTTLKNQAVRFDRRDTEILPMIDSDIRRIDDYEATARALLELARPLLTAVREERFETVIQRVQDLEDRKSVV